MIELFAIVAGGLLVAASWMLYSITKRSQNGQTFCGRVPDENKSGNSGNEVHISADDIKKEK